MPCLRIDWRRHGPIWPSPSPFQHWPHCWWPPQQYLAAKNPDFEGVFWCGRSMNLILHKSIQIQHTETSPHVQAGVPQIFVRTVPSGRSKCSSKWWPWHVSCASKLPFEWVATAFRPFCQETLMNMTKYIPWQFDVIRDRHNSKHAKYNTDQYRLTEHIL